MVLTEAGSRRRFFALRLGVMVALILTFGLLSQIIALATLFGLAGPAFALAALVTVNAAAQLVVGARYKRSVREPGTLLWVVRAAIQELVLIGGLVAIGLGHYDAGWWAAIMYLLLTGCGTLVQYGRNEIAPRRESRRQVERRRADVKARVQHADIAIKVAESIMADSPEDEDVQSAAQQLRLAATRAREDALAELRETRSPEIQIRARGHARLRATVADPERNRVVWHDGRTLDPGDPWDFGRSDRWIG